CDRQPAAGKAVHLLEHRGNQLHRSILRRQRQLKSKLLGNRPTVWRVEQLILLAGDPASPEKRNGSIELGLRERLGWQVQEQRPVQRADKLNELFRFGVFDDDERAGII